MEKGREITGDERTLILFNALLNQGMPLEDIFVFLGLEDKEDFLKRNNLSDKLDDITLLKTEISIQIARYEEE